MKVVWATSTIRVGIVNLVRGQTWYADSEIVKAHPDLFTDDPRLATLHSDVPLPEGEFGRISDADRVEQATAGPGEKRNVRRA